jgi:type-F conjugative transfer system pilin assembly protein TrbC
MALDTAQTSIDAGTTITVTGVSFSNGHTEDGGGGGLSVIVDLADIVVKKCAFENNVANPPETTFIDSYRKNGGGGLFLAVGEMRRTSGGDVFVEQCKFSGNSTSAFGGGAYIYAVGEYRISATCQNNIFQNNRASLNGGGLWVETNQLIFANNTVKDNQAGSNGGGTLIYSGRWIYIYNNIIWSNNAEVSGLDMYIDDAWIGTKYINLFSNTYSEAIFSVGDSKSEGDNSAEDPLLAEDLSPLLGSPCIDTGDNDAPELACGDYYGHERIHSGTVDRGAIEFGSSDPEDPECNSIDPVDPTDPDPYPISLVTGGSGGGGCFIAGAMAVDPNSEAYKAAKRIAERHNSPEVQGRIEAAKKRLDPVVKKQCRQLSRVVAADARGAVDPERPELLVFVSSSMPADATMAFARDANRVKAKSHVRFVLRGFPEGGLNDYLQGIRADNYGLNLTVDPLLYDTYEIEQVPAVVVNRAVKVDHPRDLKSALTLTQAASDHNLNPLIRDLSW